VRVQRARFVRVKHRAQSKPFLAGFSTILINRKELSADGDAAAEADAQCFIRAAYQEQLSFRDRQSDRHTLSSWPS